MTRRDTLILLVFLLLGAALRFQGQAEMTQLLHHDEAAYGVDALSLLENPRLEVFFPANTGREGLWMYLLTPLLGTLGAQPLALRLTSAFVGILSLAAVYLFAREFSKRGALWAVGAFAVLYWHVHLSHIGFRVITFPLMGALAFAAILRAHRLNKNWWLAGVLLGILLYTYTAAEVYFAYGILWLLVWMVIDRSRRNGAVLALAIALLVALPLGIAMLQPSDTSLSVTRAAASGIDEIQHNLIAWGRAWLERGDRDSTHNLPNRPILDVPLAILAGLGILGAWWILRKKWLMLWWLGLVLVSLLPTILSTEAPHFLRGSGLILPLVLLLGMGGAMFELNPQPKSFATRFLVLIPLILIFGAGWNSFHDFQTWLAEDTAEFGISYDYRLNAGMAIIASESPADSPIVLTGVEGHPNAEFLAAGMNRPIYFYHWANAEDCHLSPRQSYTALDLPIISNSFAARVLPYVADIQAIYADPDNELNVFQIQPIPELINTWDTPLVGDILQMKVIAPTANTIRAGETLEISLAMRLSADFARADYRILAHLQGDLTPYEGGTLYSTADEALCSLIYDHVLDADSTAVQHLRLPIPADLPAGDYHLALGVYEADTFSRLAVNPPENAHDYFVGWRFTVLE